MRTKRRFLPLLVSLVVTVLSLQRPLAAQDIKSGEQIYAAAASAVFVVEVHDPQGNPLGFGTAFLAAPQRLVTNAHVVRQGTPFLRVGPALLECKLERTDDLNDLALLSVVTLISVAPLPLATNQPKPGATVFTLGNPSGLEKSISDGLFTGVRDTGTRKLMQISAPVSHGSSGSPLFDAQGSIVGVVVASLTEGQNLNFAVPASAVRALLDVKTAAPAIDTKTTLAQIAGLYTQLYEQEYSEDSSSPYQQLLARTATAWEHAFAAAGTDVKLLSAICLTASEYDLNVAARAGLKVLELSRNVGPAVRSATAQALYSQAMWGLSDTSPAIAKQALNVALPLVKVPATSSSRDLIIVADIHNLLKNHSDAEGYLKQALSRSEATRDENHAEILWNLVTTSFAVSKPDDARRHFAALESKHGVSAYQYKSYADWLAYLNSASDAALAYHNAALKYPATATKAKFDAICEAARQYWAAQQLDAHLSAARACLEFGSSVTNADDTLELTHRLLADTLNRRGVYEEALAHAKNALAITSDDGWASYQLAVALEKLGRHQEALVAAKAAIRSTDGKHSSFHFLVGSINFDLQNWEQARLSFQKAAEMAPTDTAAPYNISLCFQRQGYSHDAALWLEEVLRRDPNHPERADLLRRISQLRQ